MLVFVLIASLATVALVAWMTLHETRPDPDRQSGDDRTVELAVRERLYGQRAPRT
jgi:hypothetical protein